MKTDSALAETIDREDADATTTAVGAAGSEALRDSLLDAFADAEVDEFTDVDSAVASEMALPNALKQAARSGPLITVEQAKAKLGPAILDVLDRKFKGSLTEVRHTDELDLLNGS